MRRQGKITRWDDDRGFGFITWHGDGSSVFFHIKAFSGTSRRPKVGDIVSYELASGKNDKPKAVKVRFADQAKPNPKAAGRRQNGILSMAFTALFACFLIASAYFSRLSWLVVLAYFAASIVTFFAYGWDKSSARLGKSRTPESTLHTMGLLGGWPGGLAAQRYLRHKSSKKEFLAAFWVTVVLNVLAVGYLVWVGDPASIVQLVNG